MALLLDFITLFIVQGHEAIEQASESETLKKFEEQKDSSSFAKTFAKELRKGAKEMSEELKKRELKD